MAGDDDNNNNDGHGQDPVTTTPAQASCVLFDLDGTLLDTESLVDASLEIVVRRYGKEWDGRGAQKRLGKRPLEAAASVIEDYDLPCTPFDFNNEVLALLQERWKTTRPLPGSIRLVQHLHRHNVPIAVASSSPARNIKIKLSHQSGWTDYFPVIVAGDMVKNGKPAPDIFLEAARQLNAEPSKCLVIEDAPAGVLAGKAAGMQVVAVPSIPSKDARPLYSSADMILSSLLDFQPELWGLPPLNDRIGGALPMEPWYMGGPVIKGFGRGSKMLGIPTANLPTSAFSSQLADHVCGIYIGWAGLSNRGVYKMVMSVGWNPYFDNSQKAVEPWILHEFSEDFYGEELRLIVVGYIRPEANFTTIEDLVEKIHEDGRIAKAALEMKPFSDYAEDSYLTTPLPKSMNWAEDDLLEPAGSATLQCIDAIAFSLGNVFGCSLLPLQAKADRFEGVEWTSGTNGSPILIKALAYMECEVKSRLEVADHWIVYAEVTDGNVSKADGKTAAHHRKIGNYY